MPDIGTVEQPLRVAIIGSGPSGFYAADSLFKQKQFTVEIDMYDRLPTPFGLVRGGVAPDHQEIKRVTVVYDKIAANPQFCFYGNVEFGKDVTLADLKTRYHAIIYAVGAQTDRRLSIPGEALPGSHAATEFVAWYNAHPDYADLQFDLSGTRAAVVGNGNVAMDVARILASSPEELTKTDIAEYALDALAKSNIREIYMLGRRGPGQAAFTNKELKEFGELVEADVIIDPVEGQADALSKEALAKQRDAEAERNLETLALFIERGAAGRPRKIIMRFLVSPVEIMGEGKVQSLKLVRNELVQSPDGSLRPKATENFETLPIDIIFRSIGYTGVPLPDVPFDAKAGVIPNIKGRVSDPLAGKLVVGEYAVGWIKRGPSGIIGTNRPDSADTVSSLLEDIKQFPALDPALASRAAVEALLTARKPDYFTYADWQALDTAEKAAGVPKGRPRVKVYRVPEMVAIAEQAAQTKEPQAT